MEGCKGSFRASITNWLYKSWSISSSYEFFFKDSGYKQKWIILITDARPNDYDQYEGKYGIEDVNKAVGECLLNGVQVYTLAIGTEEKPTIPAMMRNASYQMLFHPERLLDSLQEFFRRAIKL